MLYRKIKIHLLFLFIGAALSTQGQSVAVVLSGGGSRGAAHVGVLKALEEHQIPIDYIVGTSIGAVIGSLYAMGYSPEELEKLICSKAFNQWASGITDDKYIYYYRKEAPNSAWISLDINFKKKFTSQLPSNIVSPYEMDYAFMELLAPATAACREDFNDLFIPFRCVVANVDSSMPMTLNAGDLARAVRGSMTIPFVFKPIQIDGSLVYDGGMYNNFPVDVALKSFRPDVIIGSRVAQRYDNPDPDDALSQLQCMLMGNQSDTIKAKNAVMIVPKLPSVNLLNFSNAQALVDSGYQATIQKLAAIRRLVQDSVSIHDVDDRRAEFKDKCRRIVFDTVLVNGATKYQAEYIRKMLMKDKKSLTSEELKTYYFQFIDQGYIKSIYPSALYNPATGNYALILDVRMAENFGIGFGGNISLGTNTEGFAELRYKYLWTKGLRFSANGYFGRFYNSFKGTSRIDFNSKLPFFLEASYTANWYNYFRNTTYFFDDKKPTYIIQNENFGEIGAGFPVSNKGKLYFSSDYALTSDKYYQNNSFSRYDTADQTTFDFFAPTTTFELNNLNRKQFASAGAFLKLEVSYINGFETFYPGSMSSNKTILKYHRQWVQFRLIYDNYFQALGPIKLGFYGELLASNKPLFSNYTSSIITAGIFEPLPEMQALFLPSFRANSYAAAGFKTILRVYKKIDLRLEGYIFQPYREIVADPVTQEASYGPILSSRSYLAAATLVYNTFLGPISLGINYYDKNPESFTLNFNIGYLIFNKRALP